MHARLPLHIGGDGLAPGKMARMQQARKRSVMDGLEEREARRRELDRLGQQRLRKTREYGDFHASTYYRDPRAERRMATVPHLRKSSSLMTLGSTNPNDRNYPAIPEEGHPLLNPLMEKGSMPELIVSLPWRAKNTELRIK
jgi:hypothetical protein